MVGERLIAQLHRHPSLYRIARAVRVRAGASLPPRVIDGLPGRVHRNDLMLRGRGPTAVEAYRATGEGVVSLLEQLLATAGRELADVQSWLDFGCGHGRVVRQLVQRVTPANVSVTDLDRDAAEFCQREFRVRAVFGSTDLADLDLGQFEVVYAISVMTHLDPSTSATFLAFLERSLVPGGLALVTTHGAGSALAADRYGPTYASQGPAICDELTKGGHVYLQYPHYRERYGMAWYSEDFVRGLVAEVPASSLEVVAMDPHALDGHQDVYFLRRRA